jgi:cytochrome P450
MRYEPFDPLSAQHQADPYRIYESLVSRGPVHRSRSGTWLVCGHALASQVLRDPIFSKDYAATLTDNYGAACATHFALRSLAQSFFVCANKAQGSIRKHFAKMLSPAQLHTHTASLRELAVSCLDRALQPAGALQPARAVRGDRADPLREFAVSYTLAALSTVFSIPGRLLEHIPALSHGITAAIDCARLPTARLVELDRHAAAAAEHYCDYFQSAEAAESECVAELLRLSQTYEISAESVFADLLFMLVAGFETTAGLIAQIAWYLAEHPETTEALARNPASIGIAVEEFARLFPSIHLVTRRPSVDFDQAGFRFLRGDRVLVLIAAANRDPEVFDNPGAFMLARPHSKRLLAFAPGPHHCIGAAFARYEVGLALETMIERRAIVQARPPRWRKLGVFRILSDVTA